VYLLCRRADLTDLPDADRAGRGARLVELIQAVPEVEHVRLHTTPAGVGVAVFVRAGTEDAAAAVAARIDALLDEAVGGPP
jgi:hypothetical protein